MNLAEVLWFIFQVFFLVLVVLGCIIILFAVLVGGVRGIRAILKPKK